jgi:hypothetical protein
MVDIQIHLETPCRAAMPWARTNIVVINPDWWRTNSWAWALRPVAEGGMNRFVFKCNAAKALLPEVGDRASIIPWRSPPLERSVGSKSKNAIFLLGGSVNKLKAAKQLIPWWKPEDPPLTVYGATEAIASLGVPPPHVTYKPGYLSEEEKQRIQQSATYHVVASAAEGFGYTFAECATLRAIPLWTALPVYEELWGSALGTLGKIAVTPNPPSDKLESGYSMSEAAFRTAMESLVGDSVPALQTYATHYTREFRDKWKRIVRLPSPTVVSVPPSPPPLLPIVAVLTLTHNRKKWWANMVENILRSTYPNEKIVWVITDDSRPEERVDRQIQQFQKAYPSQKILYKSLPRKVSIGEKRNLAIEAAIATGATLFMNMDDDDYYPPTSILARVCWIQTYGAAYCATIPMYDARNYISAMNVPPLTLKPEERVSEASLVFTKTFWEEKKFPNQSIAEGETFLEGRIHKTIEIPPEGIIVAIQHSGNATSRRVPEEKEPNGCHYGFSDEYFSYLSTIA